MRDETLRAVLGELNALALSEFERTGTARTDAVRDFIRRAEKEQPRLRKLAFTVILLIEALVGPPCGICGARTLRDEDREFRCSNEACVGSGGEKT